jgi:hypothetical protein
VSFSAPGGWGVTARGRDVTLIILVALMGAALGTINYAILQELRDTKVEHTALQQASDELVCMLALEQDDRLAAIRSGDICKYARVQAFRHGNGERPR